jgi:predicted thioesterase
MIAWMENTALELSGQSLSAEDTTVGIGLTVQHTKASKVGEEITCTATEVAVDGRKLSYKIECFDSNGNLIGTADHDRFVVNAEKFMQKVMG